MKREEPRWRIPPAGPYLLCEQNYKPGSVFDSHLSRRPVARTLKPPRERSGQPNAPIPVLLRIEFTATDSFQPSGELLPRLSTLTHHQTSRRQAVYLCCTFPEVAFGGRYPLSLPCGARTFLIDGLSACLRDCLFYSHKYFTGRREECQRGNFHDDVVISAFGRYNDKDNIIPGKAR